MRHIDFDEAFVLASVDPIDAIQRLRRQIGSEKTTEVTLTVSAWGLDLILAGFEESLRRAAGEQG